MPEINEKFIEWVRQQRLAKLDELNGYGKAHFWISAFCAEIEKREIEQDETYGEILISLGTVLRDIKKDFGL